MSSQDNIKKFLMSKQSLIVDKSSTIRSLINQVLISLGQPKNQIIEASKYSDAIQIIDKQLPLIIFTEYFVDQNLGFDLFQRVTLSGVSEKERFFCMITANSDDYAIAKAAEEEIDAYIIKPFSKDDVTHYFQKCIKEKLILTPFQASLEKIKFDIMKQNYTEAITDLNKLIQTSKKSALCYYYSGYCKQKLEQFQESLEDFNQGLKIHPGHYKCLVGKFDSLEKLQRQAEAYEVIKYLNSKYPVNPSRLGVITMLAVYTKNLSDIIKYYTIYSSLEKKDEKLSRIMSAATFAYGKYLINLKNLIEGINTLRKCVNASNRSPEYLKKIVDLLTINNEPKAAVEFLNMFSIEEQNTSAWKLMYFNAISLYESTDRILQKGKSLLDEGVIQFDIVRKMAELMKTTQKKSNVENFIYKYVDKFPDQRKALINIIDGESV